MANNSGGDKIINIICPLQSCLQIAKYAMVTLTKGAKCAIVIRSFYLCQKAQTKGILA